MGQPENGVSPASQLLDDIIREGRTPDPTNAGELGAHLERVRRRVAEKHPPSSAASVAARANGAAVPPISDLEGYTMEVNKPPDDTAIIALVVAVLASGAGFILGQLAASLGVIL